jgi:hypothetical protein
VVVRFEGAVSEDRADVARCLGEANAAGRGAEAVIVYGDERRPHVDIVRALAGGRVEVFYRNVSGIDGSLLWEVQTCAGVTGDLGGMVILEPCGDVVVLDAGR